jgi:hypothetical protein
MTTSMISSKTASIRTSAAAPNSFFSSSYGIARARFLHAAAQAGAVVHQYVHPTVRAPDGGTLSCDVAVLGPKDAKKAFVAVAGTHGPEGYAGSAAHLMLLQSGMARRLAPDCRIVLIHAINPYGFAYGSRTTENNVDLNRNFIDHGKPHPYNALYPSLHSIVCSDKYSKALHGAQVRAMLAWTEEFGINARNQALIAGQYSHPSGRTYGGRNREWSNLVLERIAVEHLHGVERIAFIDWHTGLGKYGEEFFLCFNEPGSETYEQCVKWWGADRIQSSSGFEGAERPRYQGLLFNGLSDFVRPAKFAGAVVEFGILSNDEQDAVFMLEYWLRFGDHSGVSVSAMKKVRKELAEAFTPSAPEWRSSVSKRSSKILQEALSGLSGWQAAG